MARSLSPARAALAVSLLLLLAFAAGARAGSTFYLTVERSFSTTERPEIRLDFTSDKEPLVLRVLRPKDLEKFLDGQLAISRSYEEPLATINPGHYVVRGLNQMRSPLELLRSALSIDFRKSFGGKDFNDPLRRPAAGEVAAAPAEITTGPPAGFGLVREEYIDLQKGGEVSVGLYEAIDSIFDERRYRVRTIAIDPLPDGLYLLQVTQGTSEAQALLQVSSLSVQVKQSTSQLLARVVDRALAPVAGATVAYRDERGTWIALAGTTDAAGEIRAEDAGRYDGHLVVRVVAPGGRTAFVDTDFLPATTNDPSLFVVTDRPIFKPGETFFYKGTIRERENGRLRLPSTDARRAKVRVVRADGTDTGLSQEVALGEFASFSGSFAIDATQSPGTYRLVSEVGDKAYGGEFRVRDYVKPTFYLETVERDPVIRPGETFHLKFRTRRYAGGIPVGVKYEAFVYRKRFEAPQWVEESGQGLSAGHDYFGEVRSTSALSEPQRLYSSVEARTAAGGMEEGTNAWASAAEVAADGTASVAIAMPKTPPGDADRDWIYTVMIRAMDPSGAQAVLAENLYMTVAEAVASASFARAVNEPGKDDLELRVRTTFPEGAPAAGGRGHVELALETADGRRSSLPPAAFRADDQGHAIVRIPRPASAGRLDAVAVLEAVGDERFARPFRAEHTVTLLTAAAGGAVVANRDLELYSESTVLSPGEKARVLALLPVGWGSGEKGKLWETVAGGKIFATRALEVSGRSRWFEVEAKPEYGTGFYQTLTVPLGGGRFGEQTIGFRIVPSDKRLDVKVLPEKELAEPLKPFLVSFDVRDAKGAAAAHTELSVNIVDRAVYAVQPEFRPSVLDFFYPLPRLNLATFYSDELQGYGFAAELARPNFRLTALKSNVQPVKRDMRDTAGWFPHVVTDESGHATVVADMPANVTEWVVTAIAIDKDGRVGEGKGGFRSSADLSIEARLPQFLRRGDAVDGAVAAANQTTSDVTVRVGLTASDGITLAGAGETRDVAIAAKGEQLVPAKVTADAGDRGAIVRVGAQAPGLRPGGARSFDVALKPAAVEQVFAARRSSAGLDFAIPSEAEQPELRVRVLSGLLGAALSAASELVVYPFGCTEQLAHTTLANLVLLDLIERAGIDAAGLAALGLAPTVAKARDNARSGIARLIANQKADGGFTLWPGESSSSVAVTAIAGRVLRFADDLKVEGSSRSLSRARRWLSHAVREADVIPDSTLGLFEIPLLEQIGLGGQLQDRSVDLVKHALETPSASIGELVAALDVLNERADQSWFGAQLDDATGKPVAAIARKEVAARLARRVRKLDAAPYLAKVRADFADLGFSYGEPSLIARVLGALRRAEQLDDGLRAELTRRLLVRFDRGWWHSTMETADILFAVREIIGDEADAAKTKKGARRVAIAARASGKDLELTPIPGGYVGTFAGASAEPLSHLDLTGLRELDVPSATLRAQVPFPAVVPTTSGLRVERTLYRIEASGATPLLPGSELARGDVVVSEVTVDRAIDRGIQGAAGANPSDFVVVEDGLPAIAEGIESDRTLLADAKLQADDDSFWARVKQTLRGPDRTTRVVALVPGASIAVRQVWRVAFAGKASLPPARAFDMYDDAIAGNTGAAEIVAR